MFSSGRRTCILTVLFLVFSFLALPSAPFCSQSEEDSRTGEKFNLVIRDDRISLTAHHSSLKKIITSRASGFLVQSFGENTAAMGIKKICRTMFPKPETISEKYSVPLSSKKLYLYYLRRPFDVLRKHRRLMRDMPRIKDDVYLMRWLHSKDH